MIVVADTSPLNYLILINHIDVLLALYQSVLIPPAVRDEMSHHSAHSVVKEWIVDPPHWLTVREPIAISRYLPTDLGSGEREALSLALDTHPLFVMMDEARGRQAAEAAGLPIIGTLGVLKEASLRNLLDLDSAFELLRLTNFRASSSLLLGVRQGTPSQKKRRS